MMEGAKEAIYCFKYSCGSLRQFVISFDPGNTQIFHYNYDAFSLSNKAVAAFYLLSCSGVSSCSYFKRDFERFFIDSYFYFLKVLLFLINVFTYGFLVKMISSL